MTDNFKDKTILVTGGTGSIGSEIVSQLLKHEPRQIRVYSRDETKQFELINKLGNLPVLNILVGDIRDKERLNLAMEGVDIVFQAAALKHVVSCEKNPFEAIKTNIQGTQNVIDCAFQNEVEKVIGISTDKAAAPTSVMGCTKLLAERLMLASFFYKGKKKTKFCNVRFGNVLASRGSVIPLFIKQIKSGGPVTVTDMDMSRFFMSIPQAVDLIFKASELMQDQEIFILKMPVATIGDIVRALIEIYQEKNNINMDVLPIKIIGKRAGERQHEKLLTADEAEVALETDDMFIIKPNVKFDPNYDNDNNLSGYPDAHPAALQEYASDMQPRMTLEEIKKMLLQINLNFS